MLTMIQPQMASAEQNEKNRFENFLLNIISPSWQVRQQLQETLDQFVTRLRFIL